MRNIIIYILSFGSVVFMLSCSGQHEYEGKINIRVNESVSAPLAVEVKSAAEPEVTPEQIDAFTLWVDGTKISGTYGAIKNETYKLKVGEYIAHAENCTAGYAESNPDVYGCVRYYGETEFEVKTLETVQNVSIGCSIANARVAVVISDDFSSYFVADETDVRISDTRDFSSRDLPVIADGAHVSGDNPKTAYFTAGDTVYARVTTRKQGADREMTYTVPMIASAEASTSYVVSLSVDENSTTGGITFTVKGSDITTNDFLSIQSYTVTTDFVEDK